MEVKSSTRPLRVTSKEGTYYADTKDVYFKKDVKLKDPAYELYSRFTTL